MSTPRAIALRPWAGAAAGAALLLAAFLSARHEPQRGLASYLIGFVFFTGLAAGSLALMLVHSLTGGGWGRFLRPQLAAAAGTLPLQAVLAVPLLAGLHLLYPWADPAKLSADPVLRAQSWYLEPAFFAGRTILYFAVWIAVLWLVRRRGSHPHVEPLAAVGLIAYAVTASLAGVDWLMSLMPHWHSSSFGLNVAIGWMLSAAALAVFSAVRAALPQRPADLGNLLLALVLAWAYLGSMQFLTVWSADLPAETLWYMPRLQSSWKYLAWILVVGHFALPFAALLFRRVKGNPRALSVVAALLVAENFADTLWLVAPDVRMHGFVLVWADLLAPAGMALVWLSTYARH